MEKTITNEGQPGSRILFINFNVSIVVIVIYRELESSSLDLLSKFISTSQVP
jgi:hypothetical protein